MINVFKCTLQLVTSNGCFFVFVVVSCLNTYLLSRDLSLINALFTRVLRFEKISYVHFLCIPRVICNFVLENLPKAGILCFLQ